MEGGSEGIDFADPFQECGTWRDQNSEAGDDDYDALSNFSSCEESDFDRYCSANSVLGSASVCSSVGNGSDFLDSNRSLGHGENCLSEGLSAGERIHRSRIHRDISSLGKFSGFSDGEGESSRNGSELSPSLRGISDREYIPSELCFGSGCEKVKFQPNGNASELSSSPAKTVAVNNEHGDSVKIGFHLQGSTSAWQVRDELISDEDSSIGCDQSEADDSTLDYGPDVKDGIHVNHNTKFQQNWKDKCVNENPLLLTSSLAFGNDDWEDFVGESEVNALDSFSLHGGKNCEPHSNQFEMKGNIFEFSHKQDGRDILEVSSQVSFADKSTSRELGSSIKSLLVKDDSSTILKSFVHGQDSGGEDVYEVKQDQDAGKVLQDVPQTKFTDIQFGRSNGLLYEESHDLDSLIIHSDDIASPLHSMPREESLGKLIEINEDGRLGVFQTKVQKGDDAEVGLNMEAKQAESEIITEPYDETVLEMEEILLDSGDSHGSRLHVNQGFMSRSYQIRDGSSTASTSGTDEMYIGSQSPVSIDWVEVFGAKQKKGDVSFGERLVGVKEYTVYKLRVQGGKDQWEVERRYRDFVTLYRQLKTLFSDHGLHLPSPWINVGRESRNIFGNASPSVISQRSILIQDCLRSIILFKFPLGPPSPLIWFLSPSPSRESSSSGSLKPLYHSLQKVSSDVKSNSSYCGSIEEVSTLGRTISLMVEVRQQKSLGQLLEAQHLMCAGCHRQLDTRKTLVQELAQTFGWRKPRLCEYTGQLFCLTCHTNDTAVLPARVLHHWDFSLYPVSQLAKAYLDSIYEQPMLCVSAVNPFLFSKVPALHHIMGIRKKIASMLPYVRCPFRMSVHRGLGSRRYLLESNEFFALRDLVDLSKGAFAALPTLVKTVEIKIFDHIAQRCLICYDSGASCAARQACLDPSSLIFPFQEAEAVRCSSCHLLFHQPCIAKLGSCPCGKLAPVDGKLPAERGNGTDIELDGFVDTPTQSSDAKTLAGFFSDLVSKATPEKLWRPRNSHPVILMGSLPELRD